MDTTLLRILEEAGKKTHVARLANNSEVLLLPYGGRILGLFAAGATENFYWTNPALRTAVKAREFFSSGVWQNTGGERSWLAPEIDYFFPNFPDLSVYRQPPELDAQDYRIQVSEKGPLLTTEFTIKPSRRASSISLRLTKGVESAANPIRHGMDPDLADVFFAGYGLRTTLEFISSSTISPVGLWSLMQLPNGGTMLIPTYGVDKPVLNFGHIPSKDIFQIHPNGIHYIMRAPGEQKISINAISSTGRIGYYYEADGSFNLVIKNFFVNPSGDYIDSPWATPGEGGYAVQACHVDSHLGAFSELEYHVPGIGIGGGEDKSHDFAQVWAYRGSREQIVKIAGLLLGFSI